MKTSLIVAVLTVMIFLGSGCGDSEQTVVIPGSQNTNLVLNGKSIEIRDGVLTFEEQTYQLPAECRVEINQSDGIVRVYVNGKLIDQ